MYSWNSNAQDRFGAVERVTRIPISAASLSRARTPVLLNDYFVLITADVLLRLHNGNECCRRFGLWSRDSMNIAGCKWFSSMKSTRSITNRRESWGEREREGGGREERSKDISILSGRWSGKKDRRPGGKCDEGNKKAERRGNTSSCNLGDVERPEMRTAIPPRRMWVPSRMIRRLIASSGCSSAHGAV